MVVETYHYYVLYLIIWLIVAILITVGVTVALMYKYKKFYFLLHLNWACVGLISMIFLIISPLIQSVSIVVLDVCDVEPVMFGSEKYFNKTVGTYMWGYEEFLYPCLFTEETSIYNYTPVSDPLKILLKLYTNLEQLKVINETLRVSPKVSELVLIIDNKLDNL